MGKQILVKFGAKWYPTEVDNKGVQRFLTNAENLAAFNLGELDLNLISQKVSDGIYPKQKFLELRMSLGYSVDGLCSCYPRYKVVNPLWQSDQTP